MDLAASYDAFLVDLDGTVWVGGEPVPGADLALASLRGAGKRLVFVTNDSRSSAGELAGRLRDSGIAAEPEDVLTAGVVTARAAAQHGAKSAYVIGAPALRDALEEAGLRLCGPEDAAEAEAVVVALHPGFDYAELRAATRALHAGAALFATNREPALPMPDGYWPGTGAILAAVEFASGKSATICGKPERELFEQALERLETAPERAAIIGDGLKPDVAGAAAAGIGTVLVLTGNASRSDADRADPAPDHVIESIAELAQR
jgi:glycerol-1-phosphatase